MKITAKQKIGIPILSLLLAFTMLALQHHENHSQSSDLENKESSVHELSSLKQNSLDPNQKTEANYN
ncbi:MAG: hypothetical protein ABF274_00020 [Nonlabens sp.]|uniref:hypothetical protein n=1 Tax=Nonlabens sp. TaxID=1888209 RepID=UPI00321A7A6C